MFLRSLSASHVSNPLHLALTISVNSSHPCVWPSPSPSPPISSAQALDLHFRCKTIINMESKNPCSDGNDETDEAIVDEHLTLCTSLPSKEIKSLLPEDLKHE
nr:hypothetical protein Iba_chr13aCG9010 [Ipomoea batatas]GMD79445.1 hypothetical protein Iba_chr13dCG3960 [Ipomoea batatas]